MQRLRSLREALTKVETTVQELSGQKSHHAIPECMTLYRSLFQLDSTR